jgi:hypothetical protein
MVAAIVLFILFASLAAYFQHSKPLYVATATVSFIAPSPQNSVNYYTGVIGTAGVMALSMMSPRTQEAVRAAGGTAPYSVTLVNLNNEDYPNFSNPYVTVTTTSPDPAAAQSTFSIVMRTLQQNLATLQIQQGAPPDSRIRVYLIAAPAGAVAQTGYPKRTLAGLAVIAIIVTFMVLTFLDRHPYRLRLPPGITVRKLTTTPRPGVD